MTARRGSNSVKFVAGILHIKTNLLAINLLDLCLLFHNHGLNISHAFVY